MFCTSTGLCYPHSQVGHNGTEKAATQDHQRPHIALQSCVTPPREAQPSQKRVRQQCCTQAQAENMHLWELQMPSASQMQLSGKAAEQTALLLLPCSSIHPYTHSQIFFSPLKSKYQNSSIPHHRACCSYDNDFLCGPGYIQKSHKPISGDSC